MYIPCPKFDVASLNTILQADLLLLPHDKLPRGRKILKYTLTVVDVTSRYKQAQTLISKDSACRSPGRKLFIPFTSPAFWRGLRCCRWTLGTSSWEARPKKINHKTAIRRGRPEIHGDQGIVACQPNARGALVWSLVFRSWECFSQRNGRTPGSKGSPT